MVKAQAVLPQNKQSVSKESGFGLIKPMLCQPDRLNELSQI